MVRNSENCQQISQDVISIRNAVIEDVTSDRRRMIVTVSYQILENRRTVTHMLCLIVSPNTVIHTQSQKTVPARILRTGMKVNALVCSEMTKSIPPQTKAYFITLCEEEKKTSLVRTGRVISVDLKTQSFLAGVPWNHKHQVRFFVTKNTVIYDSHQKRLGLRQLTPGMNVKIEHSELQTLSDPPQCRCSHVQIL